jgi:hypothetical protein
MPNIEKIPSDLRGKEKRQNLGDRFRKQGLYGGSLVMLLAQHPPARTAGDCLKNWDDCLGYRQYTGWEDTGSIIQMNGVDARPTGRNIWLAIGLTNGADESEANRVGFDIALAHYMKGCIDSVITSEDRSKWDAKRKANLANVAAKQKIKEDKAESFAREVFANKLTAEESAEIYSNYISKGRKIHSFVNMELSKHIFVSRVKYSYSGDPRDGETLTTVVFPLTVWDGEMYKIRALHVVYLDQSNGVYDKANVNLKKRDLASWCESTGATCNMHVDGNSTLVIGEGNETVAAYYAACKLKNPNFKADFQFTNTAVRLGNANIKGYSNVLVLIDRDRSGTGLATGRKLQHIWASRGVNVQLIMPPSLNVPIFVVVKDASEAIDLKSSIEMAKYWLQVDAVFEDIALGKGKAYKSRYNPTLVLPKGYTGDCGFENTITFEEHEAIKLAEDVPKGVDWDDVIAVDPKYISEIQDVASEYNNKHREYAA